MLKKEIKLFQVTVEHIILIIHFYWDIVRIKRTAKKW